MVTVVEMAFNKVKCRVLNIKKCCIFHNKDLVYVAIGYLKKKSGHDKSLDALGKKNINRQIKRKYTCKGNKRAVNSI